MNMNTTEAYRRLDLALTEYMAKPQADGWIDDMENQAPRVWVMVNYLVNQLDPMGDAQHQAHSAFMELEPKWGEEIAQGLADFIATTIDPSLDS